MSTHYTSVPRRVQRKRLTFFLVVLVPIVLVFAAINTWVDGSTWFLPLATFTNGYIIIAAIYRVTGNVHASQYLRIISGEALLMAAYLNYTGLAEIEVVASLGTWSAILLIGSYTESHVRQLRTLMASTNNAHAADFPGIYRITCTPNGKAYIGQTSQAITARWAEHRAHLHSGRHHNRWMQADWDLYRPEHFKWEVLEVVTNPVWLLDRERHWQDVGYDAAKRYNPPNIAPRIAKRPLMKRRKPS